jgi:hypothetical protein
VENLTVRWVLDKPTGISRDDLIGELTLMVLGYLGADKPADG